MKQISKCVQKKANVSSSVIHSTPPVFLITRESETETLAQHRNTYPHPEHLNMTMGSSGKHSFSAKGEQTKNYRIKEETGENLIVL
jgi:hypothetical protein